MVLQEEVRVHVVCRCLVARVFAQGSVSLTRPCER
jgi:hypothetical protein